MAKKTAEQKAWEAKEKRSLTQLKNTQKLEVNAYKDALKAAGLSSSDISKALSAEKSANRDEYSQARSYIKQDGYNDLSQYSGADGAVSDLTRTAYSTFDPAQYGQVDSRLDAALGLQSQFGITPGKAMENGSTGVSLTRLDKAIQEQAETGSYGSGLVGRVLDYRAGLGEGQNLTAEQIAAYGNGKDRVLKAVKGQDGLFKVQFGDRSGDNQNYFTQYYTQNPDGTYNAASLDRTKIEAPDVGGLFGNKILNAVGQVAASYFGGPIGAGLYTAASGGDLGDIAKSAALTWAGGKLTGTGAGAEGGSWYSPAGDITNPFGLLDKPTAGLPVDQVSALNPTDPNAWMNNLAGDVAASGDKIAQGLIDPVMSIDPLAGLSSTAGSFGTASGFDDLLNSNIPVNQTGTGGLDNLTNEVLKSGGSYVDPFSTGSITGVADLGSLGSSALSNINGITGLDTSGLSTVPSAIDTPTPGLLDRVTDKITSNPLDAAKLATGGLLTVDSLTGGAISGALDSALGNDTDSGSTYTPKPIDQSLVDKYSKLSPMDKLKYQQFGSLALPQGLLDQRLGMIG